MSGARFVVLRGNCAGWSGRWGSSCSTLHTGEHGYTEVAPPLMVRDEAMFGTAQLRSSRTISWQRSEPLQKLSAHHMPMKELFSNKEVMVAQVSRI